MVKFLEANGYHFLRSKGGSHHIYSNGTRCVPIPIHGNKDFGEEFIRFIPTAPLAPASRKPCLSQLSGQRTR